MTAHPLTRSPWWNKRYGIDDATVRVDNARPVDTEELRRRILDAGAKAKRESRAGWQRMDVSRATETSDADDE